MSGGRAGGRYATNERVMTENERDDSALEILFGRRSIREYAGGEVSDETLRRLLEAAMAAPSAVAMDAGSSL